MFINWNEYPYSNVHELNLDWIIKQLRILEDEVKVVVEISKNWEVEVNELNNRMLIIERENERLNLLYNTFVQEVEQKFETLKYEQALEFEILKDSIDSRFATLQNNIEITLNDFNNRINYLDNKLDTTLENLPSLIFMTSPFTGEKENIVDIIDELASTQRVNALTSLEYDNLELTALEYDNYELTAYDYDWNGKNLLV